MIVSSYKKDHLPHFTINTIIHKNRAIFFIYIYNR